MDYYEVKSGKILERKQGAFYWRGHYFSGLVTENALYDDPENIFAAVTGMKSSLEQGLIAPISPSIVP